jgi:hypothetical protein
MRSRRYRSATPEGKRDAKLTRTKSIAMTSVLMLAALLHGHGQVTQEPIGQPAPGSLRSNVDFAHQIKCQRAAQRTQQEATP